MKNCLNFGALRRTVANLRCLLGPCGPHFAMDITPEFDELLRKQNAPPTTKQVTLENIDGFLKEALRIVRAYVFLTGRN